MAKKPNFYWDSCVFIAWLNNEVETHGPGVIEGIGQMARDVDEGRAVLFTSVMTKTEVYDHKLKSQWARDEFSRFFQRRNVAVVAQDDRIGDRSRAIRDYHQKNGGITLDAGDCVHLATAIIWKADVFYTVDGNALKPKANALVPLSGNVGGHPLTIKIPMAEQGSLFSGVPIAVSAALKSKPVLKIVKSKSSKL